MERAPFVIAAAIVAGAVTLTIHLGLTPDPFATESAALVSFGVLTFAVINAAGLLLSRGRWALYLGFVVVAAHLGLALVVDLGLWVIVALAFNGVALAGLAGPWLRGWLRQRPAASGPGTRPVLLLLGDLALIPGVAVSAPGGLHWQHWLLAACAFAGALGYSRAAGTALWLLRIALVPLGAMAVSVSPTAGGVYLALHVTVVVFLAWSSESMHAIRPLLDRAYGPRSPRPLDPRAGRSA